MKAFVHVRLKLILLLAVLPLQSTIGEPHTEPPPVVATADWIESTAAQLNQQHPGLRASRSRYQAALAQAAGSRRIADPTARLGGSVFDERNMHSREEGNLSYGIEQKLPLLGKETAARSMAEAEASVAGVKVEALFQRLRLDYARAALDAALAEETVRIGVEDLTWLDLAVTVSETRFRSGQASSFDVLRLQNERARRASQQLNDGDRSHAARAWVNHALGREPLVEFPRLLLPEIGPELTGSVGLQNQAVRNGPALRILERERKSAAATLESTRRSARPDIAVGVEGREYAGDAGFRNGTVTLSLSLPWWNRAGYRRDLERDQHRLEAVEQDSADAALGLRNELHHLLIEIGNARRDALTDRDDILPRSDQALAAAYAAWTSGRGLLSDVLEARRMRLEARIRQARATAEQWIRVHELAQLCGLTVRETLRLSTR
jgi:outer membrane protein TolC